jgi:hypothetical protein
MTRCGRRRSNCFALQELLFDHLIGTAEQRERERDTERPGGLHIDDQLHLRGLVQRQVGGLLAVENPGDESAG